MARRGPAGGPPEPGTARRGNRDALCTSVSRSLTVTLRSSGVLETMPPSESLARRGLARGGGSGCALSDCWASDSNQRGAVATGAAVAAASGSVSAGPDRGPLPRARAAAAGALRLRVRLPVPGSASSCQAAVTGGAAAGRADAAGERLRLSPVRTGRGARGPLPGRPPRRWRPVDRRAGGGHGPARPPGRGRTQPSWARPRPRTRPASRRVSKTWSAGRPDQ